uniref:Uncharacterized protein n=1 Tax=Cyanoderma ruficeps TaxID=181631 RepID=A0A8C3QRI3_9PASS
MLNFILDLCNGWICIYSKLLVLQNHFSPVHQHHTVCEKLNVQKEAWILCSGYSTNSRISPEISLIEMHYLLILLSIGPHCVKHCNLTKLKRKSGNFCPRLPAISKYDQKVTGNIQKRNNLHTGKALAICRHCSAIDKM